jgi:hypothetical protein
MYTIKVSVEGEAEFLSAAGSASRAATAIQDAAVFAHNRAADYTMSSDHAAQQTDAAEQSLTSALAAGQPHEHTLQGMPITITLDIEKLNTRTPDLFIIDDPLCN